MLPAPRPYQDERDLSRMYALLEAGRAAQSSSYYVHTGDLKWWLYYPPLGKSWWAHIYLWEDPESDDLLGWSLLDPNGETFDVYTRPDLCDTPLAAAMFTWAEAALLPRARAAGCKQIGMFWVIREDRFRIDWLESSGYRATYEHIALTQSLSEPVSGFHLPEGFEVRPCRGLAEVEARARAQYGAFGSCAPFDQYAQRFAGFMQSPVYASVGDLVVAARDGRIASFCMTWTDEVNRVGLFEPVGTHPDFQHQGLGRAVMLAGLQRLQTQGMQQAIVCTQATNTAALHLYTSVGFQPYNAVRFYAKDLD